MAESRTEPLTEAAPADRPRAALPRRRRLPRVSRSLFAIDAPLGVPAGWTRPGSWVGLALEPVEWGIIAGRGLLALVGAVVMLGSQEDAGLRSLSVATGAVVLAYNAGLAAWLWRGHLRETVLAGVALDTVVVGGAIVAAYGMAGTGDVEPHALEHDLFRPALAMTVMAVLRLRPLAGAAYAVGVPALLAGLGAWVAGSAVGAVDAATHASVTIGSGIAFLLVAVAFQTTCRRLEESITEKSRLVSTVAHELRGPLTANRAYVDLVRDGSVGTVTARQQDLLARAARATARLEDMIAMFAQLETAENPQFPLRPETVSLASLAGDVREALAPAAEERGLTIELDGLDALPPVWVDRGSAEQVLTNLVSNAIKHSPKDGRIVL
ncbi:MAG: HAMP domain-containing sensor histidine kinase, partial [Dehalococcoidia bacterium]